MVVRVYEANQGDERPEGTLVYLPGLSHPKLQAPAANQPLQPRFQFTEGAGRQTMTASWPRHPTGAPQVCDEANAQLQSPGEDRQPAV